MRATCTWEEAIENYPYLLTLRSAVESLPDEATIVELGAATGKGTTAMMLGAKPGHHIVAIDNFGGSRNSSECDAWEFWDKWVTDSGFGSMKDVWLDSVGKNTTKGCVYLVEEDMDVAAKRFPAQSIDMIFLDGNHVQTFHDMLVWVPRLRSGGKFFCHDVDNPHFTVAEEFQAFCEQYGFDWNMDGELGCFTK